MPKNKKNSSQNDENYKILTKYRDFLNKTRINLSTSFDKYLLTFATGSLYLSIFFSCNFKKDLKFLEWLSLGWIFLLVSVISTLLSIFFSIKAHEQEIKNSDTEINACLEYKEVIVSPNYWNDVINIFEVLGILSFITGIILLSRFYFLNL